MQVIPQSDPLMLGVKVVYICISYTPVRVQYEYNILVITCVLGFIFTPQIKGTYEDT